MGSKTCVAPPINPEGRRVRLFRQRRALPALAVLANQGGAAEQRHPGFKVSYTGHECQWNGPSWPFATTVTLTALANVLHDYPQQEVGKADYFGTLKTYTRSHRLKRDDGTVVPWIDENLNPHTGDWISRTRLQKLTSW